VRGIGAKVAFVSDGMKNHHRRAPRIAFLTAPPTGDLTEAGVRDPHSPVGSTSRAGRPDGGARHLPAG
jgi:hypothetical protein